MDWGSPRDNDGQISEEEEKLEGLVEEEGALPRERGENAEAEGDGSSL